MSDGYTVLQLRINFGAISLPDNIAAFVSSRSDPTDESRLGAHGVKRWGPIYNEVCELLEPLHSHLVALGCIRADLPDSDDKSPNYFIVVEGKLQVAGAASVWGET